MKIVLSDKIFFDSSSSTLTFNNNNIDVDVKNDLIYAKKNEFEQPHKIINMINLIPTMMCDGACSYCYNLEDINYSKAFMTPVKFDKGVENIKDKGYDFDLRTIRLYGGEPLLNPNLAELLIHIKENYGFEILYISSGLLFNDKKFEKAKSELKKLVDYGIQVTVGVSVDFGLTDEQFTRVSNKTEITKQLLLERCSQLEDINVRTIYATIISRDTDIKLLEKEILEHHKSKHIKFNMDIMDSKADRLFAYRISVANSDDLHPSEEQIYALYNMYNRMHEQVALTSNLYPYTDVIYAPDIYKLDEDNYLFLYEPNYCGIFTDMVTMLPNGDLASCHMTPYKDSFDITQEQHDYFFKNEKCDNCDFYPVCRGLCVNRNLQAPEAMDVYCLWAKLSFELALKRSYVLAGGTDEQFKESIEKMSFDEDGEF